MILMVSPDYESGGQKFESLRARHFIGIFFASDGAVTGMLPMTLPNSAQIYRKRWPSPGNARYGHKQTSYAAS